MLRTCAVGGPTDPGGGPEVSAGVGTSAKLLATPRASCSCPLFRTGREVSRGPRGKYSAGRSGGEGSQVEVEVEVDEVEVEVGGPKDPRTSRGLERVIE